MTVTNKEEVIASIIDVSMRSAKAKDICIIELSTLNDLIPEETAERIRKEFVECNTPIKQITNLRKFVHWTKNTEMVQNLAVRYVPDDSFSITNEVVLFDSTVAIYRLAPDPLYIEINDASYAQMMRSTFNTIWQLGDNLLLAADGSTQTKQYLPISYTYKDIPVVLYPAKDDGNLEKAFDRRSPGKLEHYVNAILEKNMGLYSNAGMVLAYVWNQEETPYSDIWTIDRNSVSDDSGFLYDAVIYKGDQPVTDMGVASGNSSIVLTAEEMLLRDLILQNNLSFTEASNRKLYQARFPVGFVPAEEFYKA